MSAAPWSFTWSHCHHPPPFSPQKRSKKRQWKNAAGREMPLSFSLFGMSTELLLFCVSLGILGCFCPPSSSRQSLWITVFTWGLVKAVISFPLCGEGCFLVRWCPVFWGPRGSMEWSVHEVSRPTVTGVCLNSETSSPFSHSYLTDTLICISSLLPPLPPPTTAPVSWLVLSLEEVTSQLNYLSYVHVPALCLGNDRTVWKMFIFALIQFSWSVG